MARIVLRKEYCEAKKGREGVQYYTVFPSLDEAGSQVSASMLGSLAEKGGRDEG